MQQTRDICEAVFKNGAAVLMARIVDGAGMSVQRDQVAFVGYSIREFNPNDQTLGRRVRGHVGIELNADDVFLDRLETGRLWDIDVAGYNFRHVIRVKRGSAFPKSGAHYVIRYVMCPKDRVAPVVIQFKVRFVPK